MTDTKRWGVQGKLQPACDGAGGRGAGATSSLHADMMNRISCRRTHPYPILTCISRKSQPSGKPLCCMNTSRACLCHRLSDIRTPQPADANGHRQTVERARGGAVLSKEMLYLVIFLHVSVDFVTRLARGCLAV